MATGGSFFGSNKKKKVCKWGQEKR